MKTKLLFAVAAVSFSYCIFTKEKATEKQATGNGCIC
jgi:hypothetical protein